MDWQPPQGPPAVSPEPAKKKNRRVVAIVAALAAVAGGIALATRDDDSDNARVVAGIGYATVGPDGGTIVIPTPSTGAGITLTLPSGAVPADSELSVSARGGREGELVGLADEEIEVWSALGNYALDDEDTLVHPVFGPLVLAALTEFTGPVIEFAPDGFILNAPAEVTVPVDLLDFPDGTIPVVLVESVTGWEVIDGATIDQAAGVLRFEVTHFSRSFIGRILGNLLSNPTASTLPGQYAQALETLAAGPADAATEGVMRSALCTAGLPPTLNASAIPPASTLLDYLGFETTRVSTATGEAKSRIEDVLKAHFTANGGTSTTGPRDISLSKLVELAMNETGGDVFQALVLAHDVLRDNRNSPSIQNVMENVRGDNGDERGARYHLLGTAIYSFAYEHYRATQQLGVFWPPRAETVSSFEEAWVSGDIRTDTVEYAVDRLGARMGRDLFRQFSSIVAGEPSEDVTLLCPPTTTTTTTEVTGPTSTVPTDIELGTGDVQATLIWSGDSDMDLHVVEPNGEETYFSSKESSTGGRLDHDDIPSCGVQTGTHVENIFWPVGAAPPGDYLVYVHFYNACTPGATQSVQLTVSVNGIVVVSEAITLVDDGLSATYTVTVT